MNTKQRDLAAASALSATSAAGSGQLLAGSARVSDTPGRLILRAVALVVVYSALAVLYTWPLASHLGQGLISPLDPLDSVWRVARGQQQLLHAPAQLFNANVFYPFNRTYLFDELILGAAILALPFRLVTHNPLTIYNLAVLSSFVLSALGMYALSRRLGAHRAGAFAAGLIYAFAPFRLDHLPHLGLLSGQYFPLIIVLLDWLFAAPPAVARWRDALALAGALVMQALSAQYYAFYLVFVVGGFIALRVVQDRLAGRWPARATWARALVAGGLAALLVAPVAVAYRSVQRDYQFERSASENTLYSANLTSFVTADARNRVWGQVTKPFRMQGRYTPERNMFPGLLALLLALLGAATNWRNPLAQYLALLGLGSAALALGPGLYLTANPDTLIWSHMPYGFLLFRVPGFDSMRVPARINVLYGLSVAGLASLGLTWVLDRLAQTRLPRLSARALAAGAAALLIGVIGLECLNLPYPMTPIATGDRVPPVYRWLDQQPGAVVIELPFAISNSRNGELLNDRYQYFSLYYRQRVVNGSANVVPKGYKMLYYELQHGPTPRALAILQGLGVNQIVVHYDQLDAGEAARTRALLDRTGATTREAEFGADTVYRLAPSERFVRLRAMIPPTATVYLSKNDPLGTYGGMLGYVLGGDRIYTRVRVSFSGNYAGAPQAGARYDYGIFYRQDDPASAGFAHGHVIWEDDVVRVYAQATN
jgi:hypothetical protein